MKRRICIKSFYVCTLFTVHIIVATLIALSIKQFDDLESFKQLWTSCFRITTVKLNYIQNWVYCIRSEKRNNFDLCDNYHFKLKMKHTFWLLNTLGNSVERSKYVTYLLINSSTVKFNFTLFNSIRLTLIAM